MIKGWSLDNALGLDNEKAVLSRLGNRLYTGWDREVYVISNFPNNVPFEKMETLNTVQRWALLQACIVGLLEKVHGTVRVVEKTRIEVEVLNHGENLLHPEWLTGSPLLNGNM